jgi:type 2 lantibiotic biosynthesis protein LanM
MSTNVEKQDHLFTNFKTNRYHTGFLNFCLPLINNTIEKLKSSSPSPFKEQFLETHRIIIHNLLEKLLSLSLKTLVANYKVLKKKGVLSENTEKEQLESFQDHLREPEIQAYLFEQYPMLERWLKDEAKIWLEQTLTISKRLQKDLENLKTVFFENKDPGLLTGVTFGLGDRHRGGKSVALIEFENGKKMIYKPRSLQIDQHFASFLNELDAKINLGFKTPKVVSFESYGWVEFIEHSPCLTSAQIESYYTRKGAYLAILYALEATDFHYENIIACGEYPVLIDLESFFHPYFPTKGTETNNSINQSVLRTGILPSTIAAENKTIDISGLTDVENKEGLLSNMILKMKDGNLMYERDRGKLKGGKNIPLLNSEKKPIDKDLIPFFKQGFEKAYTYLNKHKEMIKTRLVVFAKDEVRVLFRNTVAYVHLLEESTHPKVLESEKATRDHFGHLHDKIKTNELAKVFVPLEESSLMKREVPLFTTKVNSKHLWYEDDKYLANFFESTGLETVHRKIDSLSSQDLHAQLWIIDTSFEISTSENRNISPSKRLNPDLHLLAPSQEELLQASEKVANYILNSIHCSNETCNWLIYRPSNLEGSQYQIDEASYDLFTGMPGEILFLAYLNEVTKKKKYKEIALKSLCYLDQKVNKAKNAINVLGYYAGWGSIISLYTRLGVLWNEKAYFEKIEDYLHSIDFEDLIKKDKNYSLVKGSAGFIIACTNYLQYQKSVRAEYLVVKAAKHLLKNAIKTPEYIAWKIISKKPLSGIAHGASGFALAFSKLYILTRDKTHLEIVKKILNYEKTLFEKDQKNWLDVRDIVINKNSDKNICSTAWSHGAPGIGLTRLSLLKSNIYQDYDFKEDLEVAMETTLYNGFGGKQSLSYGDFGNLEILHEYCLYFDDENTKKQMNTIIRQLIDSIDQNGWNLGSKKIYSLGMMTGITGIGYQLLKIAYPNIVPSILTGD